LKVAVQCVSPLLQRSLELFLKDNLSSIKNCDVVIRDQKVFENEKMCLLVGSDESATLRKPFSKSQLFIALEKMIDANQKNVAIKEVLKEVEMPSEKKEISELDILEKRIAKLTEDYQDNIMKAIRAFYEK
jgi:hypothetical protein